jgi:hypothetical protein
MGAAMRLMTSEPVPVPHMIGSRPAMMATTVIILGRTRSTAPSITARRGRRAGLAPGSAALLPARLPGVVEVDQHHHAGLRRHAGQRDEADRHGHRQVVAEQPHQPDAADQREGHREHHDQRLGHAPEVEVEQQEDDQQRHRHTIFSFSMARSMYSNWPLQVM